MRSTKVVYLLISLLQFIFFLKLIEYVRGDEIQTAQTFQQLLRKNGKPQPLQQAGNSEEEGAPRGLFLAPKMRRKRLDKQKNITTTPFPKPVKLANTQINRKEDGSAPQARLCPACDSAGCPSGNPISAGFPLVPFVIAIAIGVAWFALFLIFWLFFVRPDHKDQQSGGYDGGYGSPEPGYGYGGGDDSDDGKPSIFDHFMKPHERSFGSYMGLLNNVLDSVSKLTDLYNDAQ